MFCTKISRVSDSYSETLSFNLNNITATHENKSLLVHPLAAAFLTIIYEKVSLGQSTSQLLITILHTILLVVNLVTPKVVLDQCQEEQPDLTQRECWRGKPYSHGLFITNVVMVVLNVLYLVYEVALRRIRWECRKLQSNQLPTSLF